MLDAQPGVSGDRDRLEGMKWILAVLFFNIIISK